jgi:hypothetical protein
MIIYRWFQKVVPKGYKSKHFKNENKNKNKNIYTFESWDLALFLGTIGTTYTLSIIDIG